MAQILDITTILGFSLRIIIASILGFILGLERQWNKHQAGILTNVIVCVGSYAYCAFSYIANDAHGSNIDITRIAAQVVCGIGFLGAGLILRDGTNIRGLSTAATIWTTAAIGILCTLPNILFSIIIALAIVVLHLILHPFSSYINKITHYNKEKENRTECAYIISITCSEETETDIRSHLVKTIREKSNVLLHNLESHETDEGKTKIKAYITTVRKNNEVVEDILTHIGKDEGIISAGWKIDN